MLLRRSSPKCRKCLTLWQKRTSRKRSKYGGDDGTGVYMREETTSRVTAADRPYGKFYDFYGVSAENIGSTLVLYILVFRTRLRDIRLTYRCSISCKDTRYFTAPTHTTAIAPPSLQWNRHGGVLSRNNAARRGADYLLPSSAKISND